MAEPYKNLAWDDFRLVKAIADAGGKSGAAAALGINHSTVFRRLGQIEEALGAALFERHRTSYALTSAGEEMVSLAQRLDRDIVAFTRKMAGKRSSLKGSCGSRPATPFSCICSRPYSRGSIRHTRTCGSMWSLRTRR